jgi:uncharacterized iron-regulated membrane protein
MKLSIKHSLGASAGALLTSSATLVCCVLPAVLVSLGAGATLASLITAVPQLIWLSEHKIAVFGIAGLMLLGSGVLMWNARRLSCPIEPRAALACKRVRKMTLGLFSIAVLAYATGATFAFLLPRLQS